MTALLSIRNLMVAYRRDGVEVPALKAISLEITAGERLAVIGESGSGKSTLALAIAGLLAGGTRVGGRIEWSANQLQTPRSVTGEMCGRTEGGAKDHQPFQFRPLGGHDIGFVFQDPSSSLDPVMMVGKQIAEVVRTHQGLGWREAYAKAKALLGRVRLPDPEAALRAYPHQLSGGQKQRVAIATAIAAGPKLLIADEATSALDTIVQAEIVALIRSLVAEDGMTLLFISHDIALAAALADRIAVLRHGELVELDETRQIIEAPRHAYTRALLDAHLGLDTEPLLDRQGAPA